MFCGSCGMKLKETTLFCPRCGMPNKAAFKDTSGSPQPNNNININSSIKGSGHNSNASKYYK